MSTNSKLTLTMIAVLLVSMVGGPLIGSAAADHSTDTTADIVVAADGSGDYTTIQPALDAATDGDIVAVKPGTYSNITTSSSVTDAVGIIGVPNVTVMATGSASETVINAGTSGANNDGFAVNGVDGVHISGFTVTTDGNGVSIYGPASGISVTEIDLSSPTSNSGYAVWTDGATGATHQVTESWFGTTTETTIASNLHSVNSDGFVFQPYYVDSSMTQLSNEGEISATVTDSSGTALSGASVEVFDPSTGTVVASGTTDSNGVFSAIVDGGQDYSVMADADGYDHKTKTVSVAAGSTSSPSFALATATTGDLSLFVSDKSSNPISGVSVEVVNSSGSVVATGSTDSNGELVLPDIPEGDVTVNFDHADHLSTSVTASIVADDVTTKSLSMTGAGNIEITATDSNGNTLSGATVEIVDSSGVVVASGSTDSSGVYATGDLAAGEYTATVTATDYTETTKVVTVSTGQTTTQTVSLSASSTMTSTSNTHTRDTDPVTSVYADVNASESSNVTVTVAANGTTLNTKTVSVSGEQTVELSVPTENDSATDYTVTVEYDDSIVTLSGTGLLYSTSDATGGSTSSGSTPGFGAVAALAALLSIAGLATRRGGRQ